MYISTKEAAARWGISERRVRVLCQEGRIDGVIKSSWAYLIPSDAEKPRDGRQLRHRRQEHHVSAKVDFPSLAALQSEDVKSFALRCEAALPSFIVSSFAIASLTIESEDLSSLTAQRLPDHLEFSTALLAVNMHSLLRLYLRQHIKGMAFAPLGEAALLTTMERLGQGLEPSVGWQIACDEATSEALAVLLLQDSQEFQGAPLLERALFWYAEIIRIAPFSAYNEVLAATIYAQILISGGWIPSLGATDEIDQVRAALILTQRRGQYRHLIEVVAESYQSITESSD